MREVEPKKGSENKKGPANGELTLLPNGRAFYVFTEPLILGPSVMRTKMFFGYSSREQKKPFLMAVDYETNNKAKSARELTEEEARKFTLAVANTSSDLLGTLMAEFVENVDLLKEALARKNS